MPTSSGDTDGRRAAPEQGAPKRDASIRTLQQQFADSFAVLEGSLEVLFSKLTKKATDNVQDLEARVQAIDDQVTVIKAQLAKLASVMSNIEEAVASDEGIDVGGAGRGDGLRHRASLRTELRGACADTTREMDGLSVVIDAPSKSARGADRHPNARQVDDYLLQRWMEKKSQLEHVAANLAKSAARFSDTVTSSIGRS